jgi:site-specific DNA-adenine methylase
MNYGLSYLGSKSKIAEEIIQLFPEADNFYDLFAGGCAITHALLVKPKDLFHRGFKKYIINDINDTPQLFLDAIQGKYKNEKRWISRKMFIENLKQEKPDPYIKWIWSFGNDGKFYIFSKDLGLIKKAFHYIIMFDDWKYFEELYNYDFLKETLKEYGIDKPKMFLDLYKEQYHSGFGRREHLRVIKWIQKNYMNVRYSFSELERLQQLERLQRLEQLERLQRLEQDYREVKILPNSVIYCDIPYKIKGIKDYLKEEFDHKSFWKWAEKQNQPIYVSEYNYTGDNLDKWKVVYEKEKISLRICKDGKRNIRVEKVFWNKI